MCLPLVPTLFLSHFSTDFQVSSFIVFIQFYCSVITMIKLVLSMRQLFETPITAKNMFYICRTMYIIVGT